jgi:5-methyltetrahydrofolate--homocysteine methyltransferase
MIYKPNEKSLTVLHDIDLAEVARYINWKYFFSAWKITGNYEGIEQVCLCPSCEISFLQKFDSTQRDKASEALHLLRDAQQLLAEIIAEKELSAHAVFRIIPVHSEGDDIILPEDAIRLPMLRQQQIKSLSSYCLSLADFVSPKEDYIGAFSLTILGADGLKKHFDNQDDTYQGLLIQSLADRLAEATSEWLHEQIRKKYWGYASNESLDIKELFKSHYQGIRPAVGYPSLPDHSIIFLLDKILGMNQIGISITENGAMYPTSSICGLMLSHPKSQYFMIGKIGEDQLTDYAQRRGYSIAEAKKWLIDCL